MSWGRSEAAAQAWLGEHLVVWRQANGPCLFAAVPDSSAGLARLAEWRQDAKGRRQLTLWLGGETCRLSMVPALQGARSAIDAEQAVQVWLATQGRALAGWVPRLASWPCSGQEWPVAILRQDLLRQLEAERSIRGLRSVRPWWAWAVQRQCEPGAGSVCAYDGRALTTAAWDASGRVVQGDTVAPVFGIEGARRVLLRRGVTDGGEASVRCLHLRWPELAADGCAEVASAAVAANDGFGFAGWVVSGDAF